MHLINPPISYGNHQGKDINHWRRFIKQCHVLSLIELELKSMIKDNGHYSIQGIYMTLPKGRSMAESEDPLMLPCDSSNSTLNIQESAPPKSKISSRPLEEKRNRVGKGSYTLSLVRKFLKEPENWKKVDTTKCYHFPGAFQKKCIQQLYYIPDVAKLEQTCDDTHFYGRTFSSPKGNSIRRD